MRSFRTLCKTMLVAGAVALAPSSLLACAACYGRSDSALAEGLNWGIFTLLGVVLTVLTCILVFFVHIVRQEEKASSNPAPVNPPKL
jgi:heme/copper-type cytochrome/quinol oxidase subunit 2